MTVQNCGEQVTIAKEPKRIVTFGYEAVDLINSAGGASRIVGTFDNTKDPTDPVFTAVPDPELASDKEATTEPVLALRPDLVVSYGLFEVNLASLQQSGASSLIVSGLCGQHGGGQYQGATFDNIYRDIETLGRILGTQAQAQAAVEQLKQRVAAVPKDGAGKTAAHGYFCCGGFFASGNQSMLQSEMDALGLKNVFSDVPKDFFGGSTEELIKRDPQIMILTYLAPAERVMAIGDSAHEAVADAGGLGKIVARAGEFGEPPPDHIAQALKTVPIIDPQDPGAEAIVNTKADLVISYGLFETTAEDLEKSGVKSLVQSGYCGQHGGGTSDGHADFDDIYTDLQAYGHLFGTQARADKTVADVRERVATIRSQRAGKPRLTAAKVGYVGEDLYTSGKQSMEQTIMDTAGLDNVFGNLLPDKAFEKISLEKLVELDPDVLLVEYGHVEGETLADANKKILALPGASDMKAFKSNHVIGLLLAETSPSPLAVEGLQKIVNALNTFQ